MRSLSTSSSCILKTADDGDSAMPLARLFWWMVALIVKNYLLQWNETFPGATCTRDLLSSPHSFFCLCDHPLSTRILWWGSSWAFAFPRRKEGHSWAFSREKRSNSFSLLTGQVLQPLDHLCGPSLDLLQSIPIFFELWGQLINK